MKKTLVVMAAGIGSRYKGFKQIDSVGPDGEFIIDYSVYDAIKAGFNKVIFIIQHDIEAEFKATIGKRIVGNIEIAYSFQELNDLPRQIEINPQRTKPWGTVQAILTCGKLIDSPFAVVNADDFYGKDSYRKLSQFLDTALPDKNIYCMMGFKLSNTLSEYGGVTRGICKSSKNNMLDNIVEISGIGYKEGRIYFEDLAGNKSELTGDTLVSMNMWGFTPSILGLLEEEFQIFLQSYAKDLKRELVVPTAVNSLITKGRALVQVLGTSSDWFGITYRSDKDEVKTRIRQLIQAGEYPNNLWEGCYGTGIA
ncbi:MAG: sugar phosphate nucleotidyltransferase [Sedimentisphaerales bacterium]